MYTWLSEGCTPCFQKVKRKQKKSFLANALKYFHRENACCCCWGRERVGSKKLWLLCEPASYRKQCPNPRSCLGNPAPAGSGPLLLTFLHFRHTPLCPAATFRGERCMSYVSKYSIFLHLTLSSYTSFTTFLIIFVT